MKYNFIVIGFLAVLLGLQGCNGFLTVDVPDSLVKEDYWKSRDHAKAALTGIYTRLGENIGQFIKWGGLRSEIYDIRNLNAEHIQFLDQDIRITNSLCKWEKVYSGIYWTNSFLKNAHLVMENDRSVTQTELNEMLGQAYTIRALYYFYLVRTFRDVPYHSEPYESDTQAPYAAAVPEAIVLDSIEADLARAIHMAPESFSRPDENCGYITRNAVRALWADVKLWRKKYEECITLCEELDKEYDTKMLTWDTWFSMFSVGNSKESIFEFQYQEEGPSSPVGDLFNGAVVANQPAFLYNVRKVYPQSGAYITSDTVRYRRTMFRLFTGTDVYYGVFKYQVVSEDEGGNYVLRDANGLRKVNYIFYRYREVLLMKAEALGMLGRYEEAAEAINKIRMATALETTTVEELGSDNIFLDHLICEWRAELGFEGKDWFTLLRIARNSDYPDLLRDRIGEHSASTVKEQTLKAHLENPESWFLPYHDAEVQANLLLKQKDFYKGKK